jgi:diaminopimelate epimerase
MEFTFTKMEGLGNDYLYVYDDPDKYDAPALSVKLSERHFGAGSDGMIWIMPSDNADFKMRIFNADGSEAKMCGNGIRCVGKFVYDHGYTAKDHLLIDTLSGIKALDLKIEDGVAVGATVNMGKVDVSEPKTIDAGGEQVTCRPVSVGNPHAVIFVDDAENAPLTTLGPKVEKHPAFPGGVNTEFVQVIDNHHLRMRVWERGSGVTLACGTGACASVAAAVAAGYCPIDEEVTVTLDGGDLHIKITDDGAAVMTGPATTVYKGEVTL